MQKTVTIEQIEKSLESLPANEQLRLIEKLARLIRKQEKKRNQTLIWSDLYGSGKGIWDGEDAQEYVNRMREDRS
ncbi:MAG: hypothetical protein NTW14_09000 [bacterium]|nr:hypothetical protein [bacterium]